MRTSLASSVFVALVVLTLSRTSRAEAPIAEAAPAETPPRWIVSVNPLPLLYQTASAELEVAASPSFGVVVNPSYTFLDDEHHGVSGEPGSASSTHVRGFGGELGGRFYPSFPGASVRLFLGPSLLYGAYSISNDSRGGGCTCSRFGVAFDVGFTHVTRSGFTIKAGGGLQYTETQGAPSFGSSGDAVLFSSVTTSSIFFGSGVRPRLLASAGWAF